MGLSQLCPILEEYLVFPLSQRKCKTFHRFLEWATEVYVPVNWVNWQMDAVKATRCQETQVACNSLGSLWLLYELVFITHSVSTSKAAALKNWGRITRKLQTVLSEVVQTRSWRVREQFFRILNNGTSLNMNA